MINKTADFLIEVKSYDEEQRYLAGIATTPTVDRVGDVVEPLGAKFEKEIPLLVGHDTALRIGRVRLGNPTIKGIPFEAWIPKVAEPGPLRDRVDMAWQEVKYGLLKTTSIGFRILDNAVEKIATGYRFVKTEIMELSLVPVAAQADARINYFKSIASSQLAALGRNTATKPTQPARAGVPNAKGNGMKTYTQEALSAMRDDRKTKAARMEELREVKQAEGRQFTEEEREEFDALDNEIVELNDEIRVAQHHVGNIMSAKPLPNEARRGAPYGFVKHVKDAEEKFKGEIGLKRAIANIYAQGQLRKGIVVNPVQFVEERWGKTNPTLVAIMKAAVAGGGTDSGEWGAELAQADTRYTGDFIEYLYAKTVFDRLPLVEVPHNVVIKGQDGAFTGYFIGQSKAIKVSKGDFSTTTTTGYKAAGMTTASNELLRDSSPSAMDLIGTGLRNAVAQAIDSLFFSATAISAGVAPAGILNGVSAGTSSGNDSASIAADIAALWAPFIAANNTDGRFAYVTTPTLAVALSLMQNALGQSQYPGITATGGTFQGYPLYVGGNIGAGDVILMNCSEIWRIGDLGVSLSASDSAMIEQDSAPTGATDTPTAASATMVSMYQEDSTAIRVIRPISWGKRRSGTGGAVSYIGNAAWGTESS